MSNLMQIGRRILPIEHVALIESYIQQPEAPLRTSREFKSRIVLLNRDSVLSEVPPEEIAEQYAFRMLPADGVATNPTIHFGVEQFEPAAGFTPSKDYLTRTSWHDWDGNVQSKLLLTPPETTLAVAVRGEATDTADIQQQPACSKRKRAPATPGGPKS